MSQIAWALMATAGGPVAALTIMAWLSSASNYLKAPSVHLQNLPALVPLYWRVLLALKKPRKLRRPSLPAKVITTGTGRKASAFTFSAFCLVHSFRRWDLPKLKNKPPVK